MAKRPRDPNQLAKMIVDIATGESDDTVSGSKKNPPARRKGGLKGGPARASKLTPSLRSAIARKAAKSRWHHREK
jgi:hypothetical protein